MTEMTLEHLNEKFEIVDTPIIDWPKDLSSKPLDAPLEGDCKTYARTVRNILKCDPWAAIVWQCWSEQNRSRFPYLPRHAVIWVKGRGWIDSTTREFRRTPAPCWRLWPVGTPVTLWLIYTFGVFKGWWSYNPVDWFL